MNSITKLLALALACATVGIAATPANKPEDPAPFWASASGQDAFGYYADLKVNDVTQRMRWIAPGTFTMGSPVGEAGRNENETQHPVTLTKGYWLADSPCTQNLWVAVVGVNPSHFKAADGVWQELPVETVSWDDCQTLFTGKLNAQFAGLRAALPTEAQYEYACRAGSGTAIYTGALTIRGGFDGPELDLIAWYGGNSGEGLEVTNPNSIKYNEKERQYPGQNSGPHRVKMKAANAWGLYDMCGNMWEWVGDWYDDYPPGAATDPTGPASGEKRILRGGGWGSNPRNCRSAQRDKQPPSKGAFLAWGFRFVIPANARP